MYRLDERRALVQTVDFFTPVVDDPVAYGRIAGANALSDIYAMGGRPLTALAIAGFPEGCRPRRCCRRFSGAGSRRSSEAGVALLGGHTVQDQEIKFGYAVTGEVDPARIWTNAGAPAGRPAVPDQADRDRRDRDGDQVRPARRRRSADARDRVDGAAESRRRRGAARACRPAPSTPAPT